MNNYLITYDNHAPRDYLRLYEVLRLMGAVRLAQSVWLVKTGAGAGVIRDRVQAAIERNDCVAVVTLAPGSMWATRNAEREGTDFLSRNISRSIAA